MRVALPVSDARGGARLARPRRSVRGREPQKGGGVQDEAGGEGFRDDARRLLRVSYERQVAGGGRVTHVDLGAGAEELGMDAAGHRFAALVDYVEVVGWAEEDLFANDALGGGAVRRITARGLAVVGEA